MALVCFDLIVAGRSGSLDTLLFGLEVRFRKKSPSRRRRRLTHLNTVLIRPANVPV
ncbi:hypothetical protein ES707_03902 [subsurface metagenome]